MTPGPTVLVTGATGTLGPALLPHLLYRGSVVALVRPGHEGLAERSAGLLAAVRTADPGAPVERLAIVAGDLTRSGAGLATPDRRRLSRDVTHVLHLAADTRFSLPLPEALAANLDTTQELLRVVADFDRLRAFGFVSTLYVAGNRTGVIREEDLAEAGFVNTYERAKFDTERALRELMADVPIAVYRVATLLGSARTGEVRKPTAIHQAMRLYYRGLIPMIPGDPAETVELIDVEHAAEAAALLLLERFAPGATYHLTTGPDRRVTLGELVEQAHRGFGELDPAWKHRGIEPPPVVRAGTYGLFERTVLEAADPAMAAVVRTISTFLPQLLYPKRFARTNTEAALPEWHPPHVSEYLPKVLAHCLHTRWSRAVSRQEPAATAR